MNNLPLKIGLLIFIGTLGFLSFYNKSITCDCVARISYENNDINDGINLDSLFRLPDSSELKVVLEEWKTFNPQSESFKIIKQYAYVNNRQLILLEHFAEGQKHYGIILTPSQFDSTQKYPLLLYATGLNQATPIYNLDHSYIKSLLPKFENYFIVIPSFRGQAFQIGDEKYCSDGFFGDAFDGATDDALRLLFLAKKQFSENINTKRMVSYGVSRGGTVALLAGIRSPELNGVISTTGPSDFSSREVYNRYNFQFRYQYLSEVKPMMELRKKMLRSSPIHFVENISQPVFLLYGKNDRVVPLSNAERILKKLEGKNDLEYFFPEAGHSFEESDRVVEWLEKYNN
ncbi:MAG: alpha/beta hydrolase family protein [Saprospiraceae bacterium]